MKTLSTKRLILRDWCENDIGCEVYDEKTVRYLIRTKDNYAVVLKENNEVIGTIGINEDAEHNPNARNVGVKIIPKYRNQGFITEALRAVVESVDDITDTLSWCCKAEDTRSQHIAKKLGFVYIKTFEKDKYNLQSDFHYYILKLNSNKF